jgi:hypothetical protein
MTAPLRYFVAKYISDLQRMEPRNIGVIVWCGDGASARFVAERPDKPGEVDGRSIPPFVTSTAAYKQWVEFWRAELESKPPRSGKGLQRWSDNLRCTGRGNFLLAEGGTILSEIEPRDLGRLATDLFHKLVEPAWDEARDLALDQVADDLIRQLRLTQNPHFQTRYRVNCPVTPKVTEAFEFSHAYGNGTLERLYQRVPLANKGITLRRVVHDSAWMFEKVVEHKIVTKHQAIALVYATEERRKEPGVRSCFDVLESVARVANLAEPDQALNAFLVS